MWRKPSLVLLMVVGMVAPWFMTTNEWRPLVAFCELVIVVTAFELGSLAGRERK